MSKLITGKRVFAQMVAWMCQSLETKYLQQIGRMLRLIAHAIVLRNVSAVLSAATPQNA